MRRGIPGRPAIIVDDIEKMKVGDEALIKIDHLYMLGANEGHLRPCTRLALQGEQQPPQQQANPSEDASGTIIESSVEPAAPMPEQRAEPLPLIPGRQAARNSMPAPTMGSGNTQSSGFSFSISSSSSGTQSMREEYAYDARTGQQVRRLFINGVEVDPNTKQPLPTP